MDLVSAKRALALPKVLWVTCALALQGCVSTWAVTFEAGDANYYPVGGAVCSDGYRIAGHVDGNSSNGIESNAWLMRLDSDGEVVWSADYGYEEGSLSKFLSMKTSSPLWGFAEGEVVAAGWSNTEQGHGGKDGWVAIADADGNLENAALFGGAAADTFSEIVPTADGGYVAVGITNSFKEGATDLDVYIVKMDADLETVWEWWYGGDDDDRGEHIEELADPEDPSNAIYLVSATTDSFGGGHDWWILLLREDGTIEAQETLGGGGYDRSPIALRVYDDEGLPDGFVVAGVIQDIPDGSPDNAAVLRLWNNGEIHWAYAYGLELGQGEIHTATLSSSGDALFGGWASDSDDDDAWMFEVDKDDGHVKWSKKYSELGGFEMLSGIDSVVTVGTGGLLATSWGTSTSGNRTPLVFRTDTEGDIEKCSLISDRDVLVTDIIQYVDRTMPQFDAQEVGPTAISGLKTDIGDTGFAATKKCPNDCVYYADAESTAAFPDGEEWSTAFPRLQDGIDAAATDVATSPSGYCEVWAKQGKYHIYETAPENTVALAENVHVYGGFEGTSEYFSEREWETYQSHLLGDQEGDEDRRVYHVVTGADDALLDGFYVSRGHAPGSAEEDIADYIGGGMLNVGVSPTVQYCEFSDNYAAAMGGAVLNYAGAPVFAHVAFRGNGAGADEGNPTLYGGAAMNVSSQAEFRGCAFAQNQASTAGGAVASWMRGERPLAPVFREDVFTANMAPFGAAMFNINDAASAGHPWIAPWTINSLFYGNTATRPSLYGGTILNAGAQAHPVFLSCTVADNVATAITGGMQNVASAPVVMNSIFWGNHLGLVSEISSDTSSTPWVGYSDVQGGWLGSGTGNIDSDVDFVIGGYKLQEGSPCIDTGLDLEATLPPALTEYVDHDLDYESRPGGSAGYDMGCYEGGE